MERIFYSIDVRFNPRRRSEGFRVFGEELRTVSDWAYYIGKGVSESYRAISIGEDKRQRVGVNRAQPALTQFLDPDSRWSGYPHDSELAIYDGLGSIRFLELLPERMREPSIPGATILGDSGENLPSVPEAICADSGRGKTLMSWLQELTPMDVKDFDFPRDPSGRVHLHIVERNGRKVSAYSASDGAMRFRGGCIFFAENAWEEIETWVLAGLDLPNDWRWQDVRAEVDVKERYFEPMASLRGLTETTGDGRKTLGEEASRRIRAISRKCPEDFDPWPSGWRLPYRQPKRGHHGTENRFETLARGGRTAGRPQDRRAFAVHIRR